MRDEEKERGRNTWRRVVSNGKKGARDGERERGSGRERERGEREGERDGGGGEREGETPAASRRLLKK